MCSENENYFSIILNINLCKILNFLKYIFATISKYITYKKYTRTSVIIIIIYYYKKILNILAY